MSATHPNAAALTANGAAAGGFGLGQLVVVLLCALALVGLLIVGFAPLALRSRLSRQGWARAATDGADELPWARDDDDEVYHRAL